MEIMTTESTLLLTFGLGLVHALDADHIMGLATIVMSYVLLFGLGVILSMALFGGVIAQGYRQLERFGNKFVVRVRALVALSSIDLGAHLVYGYL